MTREGQSAFSSSALSALSRRRDLVLALLCVTYGILISTLPHLVQWQKSGDSTWIASYDELVCYYPITSQSYFNHPARVADPTFANGGESMFPALQFVPFSVVAKAFGDPLIVGVAWRFWAGLSMSLGFFLVARHFLKHSLAAAAVSCILMADAGMIWGRPLLNQCLVAWGLLQENPPEWYFGSHPVLLLQWRLITPAVSLCFLLLHIWLMARANAQPSRQNLVLAGASFGLLFYTYFYFWTAAGFALVIGAILDSSRRKSFLLTGCAGAIIGLPSIAGGWLMKKQFGLDWLQRTDKFVPIGHFDDLIIPKLATICLLFGGIWIWKKRREWLHLWAISTAGLLLQNHQVITGLEIENSHWGYVLFIALSFLMVMGLAAFALKYFEDKHQWRWTLGILCGLHLFAGLWIRAEECAHSRQTLAIMGNFERFQDQLEQHPNRSFVPNSVIAGDPTFVDFAVITDNVRPLERTAFLSPGVSAEDWDTRVALDAWLRGISLRDFESAQRAEFESNPKGSWGRRPDLAQQRIARRVTIFAKIATGPKPVLDRFVIKYLVLPSGVEPPKIVSQEWQNIEPGPFWQIWERPK